MAKEPPRFVIVDAHSHALRAYHALGPMAAPDGLPTQAIFGLAGLLHRLVFEDRPDYLAIVFDAPDDSRTTFRTDLYPAYKANRSARPADLTAQMPYLRALARAFGLTPLEHPRYEADDLVAALTAQADPAGLQTTILSADKDLMQLVTERTTLWDTMRGRRYTPQAVKEKLGVAPCAVADYLALVGDSSDNVPGVPGIGPKSASRLLEDHKDLDGIYADLPTLSARERARLEPHREVAYLSRALTRLDGTAPLPCGLNDFAHLTPELDALADLFARLGFRAFRLPSSRHPAPTPAPAPAPTPTQAPTPASTHTQAPARTPTPAPTPAPTQAPTPASTHTQAPTPAPTPTPTPTPASTPTPAPAPAPTPTPASTPTPAPAPTPAPTPTPAPAPTPTPTQAPAPTPTQAPTPTPARRLRPTPSELACLFADLDPGLVTTLALVARDDLLELTLTDLIIEVPLRTRAHPQAGLFDAPAPLSGPELAALLTRHLGPGAAHLPLTRGHTHEPALAALSRWGCA